MTNQALQANQYTLRGIKWTSNDAAQRAASCGGIEPGEHQGYTGPFQQSPIVSGRNRSRWRMPGSQAGGQYSKCGEKCADDKLDFMVDRNSR